MSIKTIFTRLSNQLKKDQNPRNSPKRLQKRKVKELKSYRLGLTLSGGSARGFAHIGVLKALEEYAISPDIISGTSMGAIIGVLYAAGHSPDHILKLVKKDKIFSMVSIKIGNNGLFQLDALKRILSGEIPEDDFSALKIPFYLSVANISEGKNEIIHEGPLFDFVLASSSVPIIIVPQVIKGTTYVDGGLFDNMPAAAIRDKCKHLIGVHVNYKGYVDEFDGIREVAQRTFSLSVEQNTMASREMCDFIIEPHEIQSYSLLDFDKVDELVEIGYNSAIKVIKEKIQPTLAKS